MSDFSSAASVVHCNISIAKLKALVKTFGETRYVIAPDGKIHAAKSSRFIHNDIKREAYESRGEERPKTGLFFQGYANWDEKKQKFLHYLSYVCNHNERIFHSSREKVKKHHHPKFEELGTRGFEHCDDGIPYIAR